MFNPFPLDVNSAYTTVRVVLYHQHTFSSSSWSMKLAASWASFFADSARAAAVVTLTALSGSPGVCTVTPTYTGKDTCTCTSNCT